MTPQYITINNPDGLPDPGCSPTHLPYTASDFVTYTAQISPYTTSPPESSIPTPISSSSSPPLPQRGHKTMQQQPYHSPQQQYPPSPPATSGLFWNHAPYHSLNGNTSQASSPGAIHPQVTEATLDMNTYVHAGDETTTTEGFSTYPLTGATTPEIPQFNPYPSMDGGLGGVTLGEHTLQPLGHPAMVSAGHYQFPHRPLMIDPAPPCFTSPKRRRAPTKRKAPQNRVKKSAVKAAEARKSKSEMKEMLKLKAGAPEEAEFLMAARVAHDQVKGKGMWDKITADFSGKYGEKNRPALQMQIQRLIMKWLEWPESEDECLRNAIQYVEESYYKLVLERMKETGGCQSWDWKVKNIQKRAVELGLAEVGEEENKKVRKRRKVARRRSTTTFSSPNWPIEPTHSQHASFDSNAPLGEPFIKLDMPSDKEDELIERLLKEDPESDGYEHRDSSILEVPEPQEYTSEVEEYHVVNHDQSQRVALQACQELMQQHSQGVQ